MRDKDNIAPRCGADPMVGGLPHTRRKLSMRLVAFDARLVTRLPTRKLFWVLDFAFVGLEAFPDSIGTLCKPGIRVDLGASAFTQQSGGLDGPAKVRGDHHWLWCEFRP